MYQFTFVDLDGKKRTHRFNASSMAFAIKFSHAFCDRFGFKFCSIAGGR